MTPEEKAAPLVYVVMGATYPDSVWWTESEARDRQAELRKLAVTYPSVLYYRVGEKRGVRCS